MNKTKNLFMLLICLLLLGACARPIWITTALVTQGDLTDVNLKTATTSGKNRGEVRMVFDQKEIPVEISLITSPKTYSHRIELTGELAQGSVTFILLHGDGYEAYRQTGSGQIQLGSGGDMYQGEYRIRLEFDGARSGNLVLKYKWFDL